MIIYLAIVATLALLVSLAHLLLEMRTARPMRRAAAVVRAAEHGVAYAEQISRKKQMTAHEKFSHALHVARDELNASKVRFTEAELGRAIEASVSKAPRA